MSDHFPGMPPAGIYPGVSFDEYRSWPAINNGALSEALRSMRHFRRYMAGGYLREPTPAMRLGALVHMGRFEPLHIAETYVVMPRFEDQVRKPSGEKYDNPKGSAAYKELVDEFTTANRDKIVVPQGEYDTMLGMVKALSVHPGADRWLSGGEYEVSIVAKDPETGLWCKGRIDCLHKGESLADLKTAEDISDFGNSIAKWGYDRQMAFYGDMLGWLGEPVNARAIVAQERVGEFLIRAKPLSVRSLSIGRHEFRRLLSQIAQCVDSGEWAGYESDGEWECPDWRIPDTMAIKDGQLISL